MENGLFLALFAAVAFSINAVYIRRATALTGESFTSVTTGIFIGVIFFAVSISISGEWYKFCHLSLQSFILLSLAGIIHFVGGRLLIYNAYRLIGANKASTLLPTSPLYALFLGVIFLNESLTVSMISGIVCIVTGAILVSTEGRKAPEVYQKQHSISQKKGILAALGGAICWGTSPVLIIPAVTELGSPCVAAFISYAVAGIAIVLFFLNQQYRKYLIKINSLALLMPLFIGGISVATGQYLRYAALEYSPASTVTAIIGTSVIFVLIFSFFINRNIEVFTWKVVIGMLLTIVGTFLLFY
jgi:drug/metabolite transporter (DMT)-like permease